MASMQDLPAPTEHDAQALAQRLAVEQQSVQAPISSAATSLQPERKRRSHQKSRKGCTTCKRRKVKCSEEKPLCAQCDKLGLDCIYEVRNGASSAMPLPILECSLMYFWTTQTGKGFFDSEAWIAHVPNFAFENSYLLHAIFSVTASHQIALGLDLHSRVHMPVDDFVVRHRQQALEEFRTVLNAGVNFNNAEALFATAVLLAIQSFTIDSHTWIRMFRGTRFVAHELRKVLSGPTIWDRLILPRVETPPVPAAFPLAPLAKGALLQPIGHLARLYSLEQITQEEIFAWPALVEEPFLQLVENDDQSAMVVAYWFYNLLRRVEDQIWWTGNYGRSECERLNLLINPDLRAFLPMEPSEETQPQAEFQ